MKRTVSAREATQLLNELLEGVFNHQDEVVIEEAGKTKAVVIPAYLYESIERGRAQISDLIQRAHERNRDTEPVILEELEEEVADAVTEVTESASLST